MTASLQDAGDGNVAAAITEIDGSAKTEEINGCESIERLCGEIAVKTGELEDDLKVNCENMKNAHYDN